MQPTVPKGVLLERFHSLGKQLCKFIETQTWPPFCCIRKPKWRTWRNRLLENANIFVLVYYYLTFSLLSPSWLRKLSNHVATSSALVHSLHIWIKNSMFVNSENRFLLTVTLPSWLLSRLISNVFTTAQYIMLSKLLNHDIADAKDRCGINVPSLISIKTDWSQFLTGLKSYSLFLLLVSSEAIEF